MNHVDPELLHASDSNERYAFLIANHKKLVKIMESLTPAQHKQEVWAMDNGASPCGTSACALGWAALSEKLPGLGWYKFIPNDHRATRDHTYLPKVNDGYIGEGPCDTSANAWEVVGVAYFGDTTTADVFANSNWSRTAVINMLKGRIKSLKSDASLDIQHRPLE